LGGVSSENIHFSKGSRSLLDALVKSKALDLEVMLRPYSSSRVAAECLWKYHAQHDQPAHASAVLLQLVEWPDVECKLQDRVRYLELAVGQSKKSHSWKKEAVAEQVLRLEVAKRVQVPLLCELSSIAENQHIGEDRRFEAKTCAQDLHRLCDVRDLYQTALAFGLFHIVLVIADLREGDHDREDLSWAWVSIFCPEAACVYWPPASSSALPPAHRLFPLLTVREGSFFIGTSFYRIADDVSPHLGDVTGPGVDAFRNRSLALLEELQLMTQVRRPLWDARSIATVLEYCSCVWIHVYDASPDKASSDTDGNRCIGNATIQRSWVALDVLCSEPFSFTLSDVVQFYGRMLAQLGTWMRALQSMLPEAAGWPQLAEDDLHIHLSEVVLAVFTRWIREVKESCSDNPEIISCFRETWQQSGEGLLAGMALRLNGLQCHHPIARRLLPEALRLEALGRQTCGHAVPSAGKALQAALGPDPQRGNPQAANG
jgi:hypothetical protein